MANAQAGRGSATSEMDWNRMAPSFHSLRHQGAMAEAEASRQEQPRKPLAPLKVRSRFYWDSADWALGAAVEDLPHAAPSRRNSLDRQPSRLSRCTSATASDTAAFCCPAGNQ